LLCHGIFYIFYPNNAAIFLNRGAAMNYVQNYSRAIEDLDQAIRLDERNAAAYHNRGVAYSKMGESTRAKADLDQAKILTDR
jgi:tetratricopeptide (TPR) repeat protein